MHWLPIIKEFGPNIYNIAVVYNLVADKLSRFPPVSIYQVYPSTIRYQIRVNYLFATSVVKNTNNCFLLDILIIQREEQKYIRNIYFKLSAYMNYQRYGYYQHALGNVEII